MNIKSPTGRLACWALLIQSFNVKIDYLPGRRNVVADTLPRPLFPDFPPGEEIPICMVSITIPGRSQCEVRSQQLEDPELVKRYKASDQKPAGLIKTPVYAQRFEVLSIDLFGPLPETVGFSSSKTDSKWMELFVLIRATAEECARVLIDQIFLPFGLPRCIVGITQSFTAVYHPSANVVERKNRDLKPRLAMLVGNEHTTWSENLPSIPLAMNTVTGESTGYSAAYFTFTRELRTPDDIAHDFQCPKTHKVSRNWHKAYADSNHMFTLTPYAGEETGSPVVALKKRGRSKKPSSCPGAMVSHGRVELLAHPLSQKYLQMKWNSYGKYFHLANLLFYSVFLGFVTCFSSLLMKHDRPLSNNHFQRHYSDGNRRHYYHSSTYWKDTFNKTYEEYLAENKADILKVTMCPLMYMSAMAIVIYIGINSIREFIQIYQQKYLYFMDPINLVSWLLYVSATIMVYPIFGGTITELQFSAASLTIFLSWLNLLLLLQRFDQVGIYVVMFLEILQTLIKVLMVFSILIIAFGLAFYILLSRGEHLSFSTIPMSLMRTFSMMLGEIDFLGTFVEPYYLRKDDGRTLPFPFPAFFILLVFMVLMPILLMNLLIGLAVGDIESVRRNAQLKRLAMQVVLHTELERKLPKFLLEKIDKNELIEYPNDTKCKLGFFDSIIRRWFGNPFSDDGKVIPVDSL
ncbi:hypothetical protein ILUMI_26794, partial [Ignelater luminosus]